MALTEDEWKQLVILQCGDTETGILASTIDLLWLKNADRADLYTRFLYTKRDALDVLMATVRMKVDFKALDGASVSLSDLMDHLQQMRDDVEGLIDDEQAGILNAPAIGDITTTAPIMPPPFWPDGNDPRYKGDIYQPRPPQIGRTPD
jgi:hypothetical protein